MKFIPTKRSIVQLSVVLSVLLCVGLQRGSAQTIFGKALQFDGIDTYVSTPPINLGGGSQLTIEAWIKAYSISSSSYYEIIRQQSVGDPDWLLAFQDSGTTLSFGLTAGGQYRELDVKIAASDFEDGQWHHIAATYDGSRKRLYRDGFEIGSSITTGAIITYGSAQFIAASPDHLSGLEPFYGEIDEIRVWSACRTAEELNQSINMPLAGNEASLLAYWKFDEGAGNTATDSTGNGYNGTLVNNPVWLDSTVPTALPPIVLSVYASQVTSNSAQIVSIVNTRGASAELGLEYGTSTAYGNQLPLVTIDEGATLAITNALAGLSSDSVYHFRVFLTSGSGTFASSDISFTTETAAQPTGRCVQLDGIGGYITAPSISASNSLTIEAWVKTTNITSTGYSEIIRQQPSSGNPDFLVSFQDFGTTLSCGFKTTGGYSELHSTIQPANYADGKWHHIAATYDGTMMRLYKDGAEIASQPKSGFMAFTAANCVIGAAKGSANATEFFQGSIDEVRLWSTPRTPAEISTYASSYISGTNSGLLAYWRFDEGQGITAVDVSGNRKHGFVNGQVTWKSSTALQAKSPMLESSVVKGFLTNSITIISQLNPNDIVGSIVYEIGTSTNFGSLSTTENFAAVSDHQTIESTINNLAPNQKYFIRPRISTADQTFYGREIACFTAGSGGELALNLSGTNLLQGPKVTTITNALTLEAWFKTTNIAYVAELIRNQGTAPQPDWLLGFQSNGNFVVFGLRTSSYQELKAPVFAPDLADGTWHHIAATYSGTSKQIFIDGISVASTIQSGNISSQGTASHIGSGFIGQIEEAKIWRTARTSTEINQSLSTLLTGAEPGLAGYWRFNETSGSIAIDETKSGIGLTNAEISRVVSDAPVSSITPILTGGVLTITTNLATVTATANLDSRPTWLNIQFGTTTNYTRSATPQLIASSSGYTNVPANLSALFPGTLYHYRAIASNDLVSFGADRTFFTAGTTASNAVALNGAGQYIRLPVLDLRSSNVLSIEVWIRPVDLTAKPVATIVRQQSFSATDFSLMLTNSGRTVIFGLRTGSSYRDLQATSLQNDLTDGGWHHLAATYDGSTKRIYVDGQLVASAAQTGQIAFTGVNLSVGASNDGSTTSDFFNGGIDELRIWQRVRTPQEISQYFNKNLPSSSSGMLGYWRFDESSGNTAFDSTSNGRNAVLVNSPVSQTSSAPIIPIGILIESLPQSFGRSGANISINGLNLDAVTTIMFNGIPASFAINSSSNIVAIVPDGATTGFVRASSDNAESLSPEVFIVDNIAPIVSISSPVSSSISKSLANVAGSIGDSGGSGIGSVLLYVQRASDFLFWTGTNWSAPTPLNTALAGNSWISSHDFSNKINFPDGAYTVYAVASDRAGNSSSSIVFVTVNAANQTATISKSSNADWKLRFFGIPGHAYSLQSSDDLLNWVEIGTDYGTSDGFVEFTDRTNLPVRFYRAIPVE